MSAIRETTTIEPGHPTSEPWPRRAAMDDIAVDRQAVRSGLSFMVLVFALCMSSYVVPWLVR